MKLLHLTPGTGSFHCGSCLRDNALVVALRARGHDALMLPLYLPLVTDKDEANPEQTVKVGGVTLYLQQRYPRLARWLPGFLMRYLDSDAVLRMASRFMGMTSARDLGEMTVGSLQGEQGNQWQQWEQLVKWMEDDKERPDAILLSNSLLIGLCPALKKRLGVPLLVSLQGEDAFLDSLTEPYRTEAWRLMQENAKSVTCFVSPSRFYAETMAPRLGVRLEDVAVVYNGLNFEPYMGTRVEPGTPTIGYLARMIHGKGLTTLVEAFILLAQQGTVPDVKLRIAGSYTEGDRKYVEGLKEKLRVAGLESRVSFEPNVSFEEKVDFLHDVTVFSVPMTGGEAFGLYLVEAQACGLPVVQPEHGAFPELLELTEGGVLCPADDVAALADKMADLLTDHILRQELSQRGRENTRRVFSAARMAERFEALLKEKVARD